MTNQGWKIGYYILRMPGVINRQETERESKIPVMSENKSKAESPKQGNSALLLSIFNLQPAKEVPASKP